MAKGIKKRNETYNQLMQQLLMAGYDRQFYIDQLDEYMFFYDNLQTLNEKLSLKDLDTRSFNEILKEKRQVTKEMRNILMFFNLQPSGGLIGLGDDEDEVL